MRCGESFVQPAVFVDQLNDVANDVAELAEPGPGSATPATVLAATEEIFLNNALLEAGHAVHCDGSGPKDSEV
jgi:hypothetical protein